MTSIISVYSNARCISSCNYNCYYAMQPTELKEPRRNACTCICGGKNHGLGRAHAILNRQRGTGLTRADLEAFAAAHGLDANDLVVIDRLKVPTAYLARKLAKKLFNPPPIPADDLFACEEVSA